MGRAKYLSALIRSRNQGNDFRIYYAIYVPNETQYKKLEEIFKKKYESRNVPADEGQLELYNIKDEEIKQIVDDMVEHATDINLNLKRQLVMYELKDYLNSINFTKQDLIDDGDVF